MIAVEPAVDSLGPRGRAPARPHRAAALERARGIARLAVRAEDGRTRLVENYQSGSAKIRFPRTHAGDPFTAVLVNTAGGITGGDRFSWSIAVGHRRRRDRRRPGGRAHLPPQRRRRHGRDRAQRRRRRRARLAAAGDHPLRPLVAEAHAHRRCRSRRPGCSPSNPSCSAAPPWARPPATSPSAIPGASAATAAWSSPTACGSTATPRQTLAGTATGSGARALATVVLVAPDAESAIDRARCRPDRQCRRGGGERLERHAGRPPRSHRDGQALRADVIRLIETLRGRAMPRVWNC